MTLRLTLRERLAVPVEAEFLTPDRLAGRSAAEIAADWVWYGNRAVPVGDLFVIRGAFDGDVRVEGDLRRVKLLGAGMRAGRMTVDGDVGMHAGAGMHGGTLEVAGDAGDFAGAEMRGGQILIRGSAGRALGGAYLGARAGMCGGEIVVHGDAGGETGARLQRGLIAVGGAAGPGVALGMLAGTIVICGTVDGPPGGGLRRGTIVTMRRPALLPSYMFDTVLRPPFLRLVLRRLRVLGLPVADAAVEDRYERWAGDGLEAADGEILIPESAHGR